MKKHTSSIPSLTVDDRTVISAKEKASILNDQFQSVFTVEDLTAIPEIGTGNSIHCNLFDFLNLGFRFLCKPSSQQITRS